MRAKPPSAKGGVPLRSTLLPTPLPGKMPRLIRRCPLPFSIRFFFFFSFLETHQGLSQERDSPVTPGAPLRGLGGAPSLLGPLSGPVSVEDFSPLGGPTAATLSIASWLPWKRVSRGVCFSPSLNKEEYRAL